MMSNSTEDTNQEVEIKSRPRWGRILAWGGLLALLVLLAISLNRSQAKPIAKGQPAPDFTLTTFEGETYRLSEMQGKVVLLNFWASWCKPCEQEAPDLEAAWRYYEPRGDVIFIGADYVDTETEALKYLEKFDITYPNGPDLRTEIYRDYRAKGVPETFIIDKDGNLAHFQYGVFTSMQQIISIIDPLLEP